MVIWEYQFIGDDYHDRFSRKLDELGLEGWELVSVIVDPAPAPDEWKLVAYFKRPRDLSED